MNIHAQWYKLDNLKNLKLNLKMLQNISLIVCIKKATKCVDIFPSQNDLNWALDVGVCQIYFFIKLFMNTLIELLSQIHTILNNQENHIFYAIKMFHNYYFFIFICPTLTTI